MSVNNEDNLFKLISALSGSEKRYFSIYAARHTVGKQNNSVRMFKKLEALKEYDEKKFLEKNNKEGFVKHYRFNKHFLYKLILQSLHAYHAGKTVEAELREQLHYIDILTEKGLFEQAKEITVSAKEKAAKYQFNELYYQLLKKELTLHREQSFAATNEEYIENLLVDFNNTLSDIEKVSEQEQVTVRISLKLTKGGFVRTKKSLDEMLGMSISDKLKKVPSQFLAAWFFYTSRIALGFIEQNFKRALDDTNSLIELAEQQPHMIKEMPKSYLAILHNKVVLLNNLQGYNEVEEVVKKIEAIPVRNQLLKNKQFYSSHNLVLSMYVKIGEFEKGLALLKIMEQKLENKDVQLISLQHEVTFHLSAGSIHFGMGHFAEANRHMMEITKHSGVIPRSDILFYARVLQLIIQFEMQKQDLLEYTVPSVYRFLSKRNRLYKFEEIILRFIRKKAAYITTQAEMVKAFTQLRDELLPLTKDPFERNAFAYFDLISWLESKIYNKPFKNIIKEKQVH